MNEQNTVLIHKTTISRQRFSVTKQRSSVEVFTDTGFPLKPSKSFEEVHHFDPKTLPNDQSNVTEVEYEDIAYINQFKQYITPLTEQQKATAIEIFQLTESNERTCVFVDRDTGYMIETCDEFQYVLKFDPLTFSKKESININEVGYWNQYKIYIHPKN